MFRYKSDLCLVGNYLVEKKVVSSSNDHGIFKGSKNFVLVYSLFEYSSE